MIGKQLVTGLEHVTRGGAAMYQQAITPAAEPE